MLKSVLAPAKASSENAKTVNCVAASDVDGLEPDLQRWAKSNEFSGKAGTVLLVPGSDGVSVKSALLGIGDASNPFCAGNLAKKLPEGVWSLQGGEGFDLRLASIGFLLGAYRYTAYKKETRIRPQLLLDPSLDRADIVRQADATWLVRDLVNTPANEMGPDQIELAARSVAKAGKAAFKIVKGDDLLAKNFPMIHAVGRASTSAPRLIDFTWGGQKSAQSYLGWQRRCI